MGNDGDCSCILPKYLNDRFPKEVVSHTNPFSCASQVFVKILINAPFSLPNNRSLPQFLCISPDSGRLGEPGTQYDINV